MYRLQLADNETNTSLGIFKVGIPVQPWPMKKTLCVNLAELIEHAWT